MELVKRGGDRQALHEVIREHALAAWAEVQAGRPNPLIESLCTDPRITQRPQGAASRSEILAWLDTSDYIGDAPVRARALAEMLQHRLARAG